MTAPSKVIIPEGMQHIIHAIKAHSPDTFMEDFEKLTSDEDRVQLIWKQPSFQDVISLEPEYCAKSSSEASKFRQNGNKYFQKKAYLSAISEYTKSLVNAPTKSSIATENELCLAYANRSAALYHFNKFDLSLGDIELSLEAGYPLDMVYKLYDRQGKCYMRLGCKENAIASFQKAEESLSHAKLEEKYLEIWKNNLKKEMEKCNQMKENKELGSCKDPKWLQAPSVGNHCNETHPNAAKSIEVGYSTEKGRHFVAGQDMRLSEVLLSEKPFASVLFQEFQSDHCYNCFQKSLAPLPCFESSSVLFCSPQCRDYAWKTYQAYEYKYAAVLENNLCGRIGQLALRVIMEAGLENVMSHVKSVEKRHDLENMEKVGLDKEGKYTGDYSSIYYLSAHTSQRRLDQLFDLSVMAGFLLKVAEITGLLKQGEQSFDSEEDMKILGGVLLRHLQVILCNACPVMQIKNPDNFHEPEPEEIGIGLYPTVSLLNHSCNPVADICYYGNQAVVRALRNFPKDQEVTVSYGVTFYDDEELMRRSHLKATYFFDCTCKACLEGWPMWLEMDQQQPIWLCEACGCVLLSDKIEDKKYARCKKCSHRQNVEEVLNQLGASHDRYSQAMVEAMNGKVESALPGLVEHLDLQQRYIEQPWRDFTACQVAVKHCFQLMGNCREK